jgi:hypothetical protein
MSYTYDATALGQFGNVVLGNTQSATGDFAAIQVLTNTTFTSIGNPTGSMSSLAGVNLAAGTILYGRFTAATVTTGLAVLYKNGIK